MESRSILSIDCRCGASRREGVARPERHATAANFTPPPTLRGRRNKRDPESARQGSNAAACDYRTRDNRQAICAPQPHCRRHEGTPPHTSPNVRAARRTDCRARRADIQTGPLPARARRGSTTRPLISCSNCGWRRAALAFARYERIVYLFSRIFGLQFPNRARPGWPELRPPVGDLHRGTAADSEAPRVACDHHSPTRPDAFCRKSSPSRM
jgi:hypothetical protein